MNAMKKEDMLNRLINTYGFEHEVVINFARLMSVLTAEQCFTVFSIYIEEATIEDFMSLE